MLCQFKRQTVLNVLTESAFEWQSFINGNSFFCFEDPIKQHIDSKIFSRYQYSRNIITMSHEK